MLTRMLQRRGTAVQWADVNSTLILSPGEIGLETDTGKFKVGNGVTTWENLSYYLKDSQNEILYSKLNATQNFVGSQILTSAQDNETPLTVTARASQSAALQRWRNASNATLAQIDHQGVLSATGANFTGTVSMSNFAITGLGAPSADSDASTKLYVDNAIAGLAWKMPINLVSASGQNTYINVPLSGTGGTVVLDGHPALTETHNGYRLLLTAQTVAANNGIYVYTQSNGTYTLTRSTDADNWSELKGASVFIQEGTVYGTSSWVQSSHYLTSFSGQVWVQFNGASQITADGGMLKVGNVLSVGGTTNRISIAADSVDIASTYVGQTSITTLGIVGTGTWSANTILVNRGGTGQTTYTTGDILYADTSSTLSKLPAGTVSLPLLSGGAGVAPLYGQIVTSALASSINASTGITYTKLQYVGSQYRVLGRISAGTGIAEELTPDNIITVIAQGTTNLSFARLPTGTTSSTVAIGSHVHAIDDLTDVIITGTPVIRQVIKYNGTNWVNELPSGGISVGPSSPLNPSAGDAWMDTGDGSLYVYFVDATPNPTAPTGQWIQVRANSALEASILTRMSSVEGRATALEASSPVVVTDQSARDAKYPSPVQGNTVFRSDLGYMQRYYSVYNATSNPSGTTGTIGWYEYRGGAPLSENYIINGGFDIWQRGDTTAITTASSYWPADRWNGKRVSYVGSGATFNRIADPGVIGLASSIRCQRNSGDNQVAGLELYHTLESKDSVKLQGKIVTLSFWAKAGANYSVVGNSLSVGVFTGTGYTTEKSLRDGFTGQAQVISYTPTLTTSWQRFSVTGTLAANLVQVGFSFNSGSFAGTAGANDYYEITGVQLEQGSVATSFRRNANSIQGELAACQRYYFRQTSPTSSTFVISHLSCYSPTVSYMMIRLPQTMRVGPTGIEVSSPSHFTVLAAGVARVATAIVAYAVNQDIAGLSITTPSSSGLTGFSGWLEAPTAGAYLGFSAEL
jgi:hypothetical protein